MLRPTARSWWVLFAGGLIIGACLAVASGLGVIAFANLTAAPSEPSHVVAQPSPTLTAAPIGTPTDIPAPTAEATASPVSDLEARFAEAEEALYVKGDADSALELLVPLSKDAQEVEDLARVYEDLGNAEVMKGQFQRAAAYYEAMLDYRPGPDSLFLVAEAYDMGGDLDHALEVYLRLIAWPDDLADPYRDQAQWRANDIMQIIGTPGP